MNEADYRFEQIYQEFRLKILRYLVRLVGEQEAEDLTQEVFIKVRQALQTFRGEAELSTWIYRIAKHAAIDRTRSPETRWMAPTESSNCLRDDCSLEIEDTNTWTGDEVPATEQLIYRGEMNQCLDDFIARLPENYRSVLVLSELEGMTNQAIAEILGLTLEAVKMRLHRARKRLSADVAKYCPSYWVEDNVFLPELQRSNLQYLQTSESGS